MKLLALRLAAFRRFGDGVAIEDFAPGVNVLAAANETGKSTVFQALEAAFHTRFAVTGSVLDGMRPHGGGEPLVEVDFEIAGARWRIRKQFGRGKDAVLTDLDRQAVVARALDAEERLASLLQLAGDGPGRFGLAWVRQQRSLRAPDPDLDPDTGKAKSRGEARALSDIIGAELEAAANGEALSAVMELATARLADLVTLGRDAARKHGPYDLALKEQTRQREALAQTRALVAACEARLERMARVSAAIAELTDPVRVAAELADIERLDRATAANAEARQQRDRMRAEAEAAERSAEQAANALSERDRLAESVEDLTAQVARIESLRSDIAARVADLNADVATPARVQRCVDLYDAVRQANAELMSRSADVAFALTPEGAARVTIEGRPVERDSRLSVADQVDIAIAGIGSIRITTADADRATAIKARRDAAAEDLATEMALLGATTLDDVKARGLVRTQSVEHLDRARGRLEGMAPSGVAAIAARRQAIVDKLAATPSRDALAERAAELQRAALDARARRAGAESGVEDDAVHAKRAADLAALRTSSAARQKTLQTFELELGELRGQQASIDEEGRAALLPLVEGALADADADVARLEREIRALRMLLRTLDDAGRDLKERYLEPVTAAIAPYLAEVFPDAGLSISRAFGLDAIVRGGVREPYGTLSDGTREQLAVLVRLGFARLLATRGQPVPLILDDPLVYADDARLAAMCRALEQAGLLHQVVVMTCRVTSFAGLAGRRLQIKPWRAGGM